MDADAPKPSINLAQKELDTAKARYAADKARKLAGLNPSPPAAGGIAEARRLGDDGRQPDGPVPSPDPGAAQS